MSGATSRGPHAFARKFGSRESERGGTVRHQPRGSVVRDASQPGSCAVSSPGGARPAPRCERRSDRRPREPDPARKEGTRLGLANEIMGCICATPAQMARSGSSGSGPSAPRSARRSSSA